MCAVVYLAELVDVTSSCWTRDLLSCTRVSGRPIPRVLRRSGLICVMKRVFVDVRDWSANDSCRCLMMQLAARWQRLPVHSPVAGSGYFCTHREGTALLRGNTGHVIWQLRCICSECCSVSAEVAAVFHSREKFRVHGFSIEGNRATL